MFQFTHPRGVRRVVFIYQNFNGSFNSRTHAGCDRYSAFVRTYIPAFQFTHPRGVRQTVRWNNRLTEDGFQFTHPRGVRLRKFLDAHTIDYVSIHAPTRGATILFIVTLVDRLFQFTHPRGVRHEFLSVLDNEDLFQFTHPRGVRLPNTCVVRLICLFQFTHPRGVRLRNVYNLFEIVSFNSRTHAGCDCIIFLFPIV